MCTVDIAMLPLLGLIQNDKIDAVYIEANVAVYVFGTMETLWEISRG